MLKTPVDILQEIVDQDGSCEDFASPGICKRCPLGNKRIDGHRVNCMDFLKITEHVSQEEASEIYKKAAEDEIFQIELENALLED